MACAPGFELRQGIGGHHGIVSDEDPGCGGCRSRRNGPCRAAPRMTLATAGCQPALFRHRRHPIGGLRVADNTRPAGGIFARLGCRHPGALPVGISSNGRATPLSNTRSSPATSGIRRSSTQRGSPNQAMFGFGTTYSFDNPRPLCGGRRRLQSQAASAALSRRAMKASPLETSARLARS